MVQAELPLFRMLTVVRLGDGKHTSFYHDKGMLSSTLVEGFPALYSHTITLRSQCTHSSPKIKRPFSVLA
jgi:hypothetical protein